MARSVSVAAAQAAPLHTPARRECKCENKAEKVDRPGVSRPKLQLPGHLKPSLFEEIGVPLLSIAEENQEPVQQRTTRASSSQECTFAPETLQTYCF